MCVFLFLSFLAFKFQIHCCLYHFQVFLNHEKTTWLSTLVKPIIIEVMFKRFLHCTFIRIHRQCPQSIFLASHLFLKVNFYDGPAMNLLLYLLPVHVHAIVGLAIIKHSSNHSIFLSNLHGVLIFSVVPLLPFFQPYLCFILLCFRHQIKPSTFTHLRWKDVTFVHAALRLRNFHPYLSLLHPSLKKHVDHNLV